MRAIEQVVSGLIDADLGGEVIKQRIARKGEGKSSGYRTIILFRREYRAFFVYGFAKKNEANIDEDDLKAFKELARDLLGITAEQLTMALTSNQLREIKK